MGSNDPGNKKDNVKRGAAKHYIKSFMIHDGYDGSAYKDIGIIETVDKIKFKNTIWPLCLPKTASENSDEFVGDLLRVISYGPPSTSQAKDREGNYTL